MLYLRNFHIQPINQQDNKEMKKTTYKKPEAFIVKLSENLMEGNINIGFGSVVDKPGLQEARRNPEADSWDEGNADSWE